MISSKKGQEMLKYITPIYAKSYIEQAIYEAIGYEFDVSDSLANDILLQLFPQTATWALVFWEQRLNIPVNLNDSLDKRRIRVITKLQTKYPITPERMANLLKNYTKEDIEITEGVSAYTFEVLLKTKNQIGTSFKDIYNTIKDIKPAHLAFEMAVDYLSELSLSESFNRWLSEPMPVCGTIDVSGNIITSSLGISYKSDFETSLVKGMTDEFKVASVDTFIIGDGKAIDENIDLQVNSYQSELLLLASEDSYIEGVNGFSTDNYIENSASKYYSELIPKSSEETICKGGS